jgi:antitoxin CptB
MLRARRAVPACKPERVLQGKGEGCEADRLRRLRWRCRRGLLELDLWLQRFADIGLDRLSDEECSAFEALLQEADADLLVWLEGREPVPENHARMLGMIRASG